MPKRAELVGVTGGRLAPAPLLLVVLVSTAASLFACGESRRPIGEECLRNEDCLSMVCAARTCVPAPALVTGATDPPEDEEPRIPSDAAAEIADADPNADADESG